MTLGWVPIEEYIFFVLQTVLTGMWLIWLGRRLANETAQPRKPGLISRYVLLGLVLAWLAAAYDPASRSWQPGTYLALEFIWLLPPIVAQVALGAGILSQQRRLVCAALFAPLLVSVGRRQHRDQRRSLDDQSTANYRHSPRRSLPLEEFIFFLLTNMLIVFGMTLFMALPLVVVWPWKRNEPRGV